MDITTVSTKCGEIIENIEKIIIGKRAELEVIISAVLANGHVLLEDVPGSGKTMLAKSLAKSFNCQFKRVQFTPDLLPSELTGLNFFNPKTGDFAFRKGSLFTNFLLADEVNRATPRTQSGLLESMEERQISIDGVSHKLEEPYFVIATQNPIDIQGTYPLPEAQLDRFLVKMELGYPNHQESVSVLSRFDKNDPFSDLQPVCDSETLKEMREAAKSVYIHKDLLDYIILLAEGTRAHESVALGISTRGSMALMNIAKAYAALSGRSFVIPDDIQKLAPYVFIHRMKMKGFAHSRGSGNESGMSVIKEIITNTTAPVEDWRKL